MLLRPLLLRPLATSIFALALATPALPVTAAAEPAQDPAIAKSSTKACSTAK